MSVADEILAIYDSRGAGAYYGEAVSMTEHALQAAHFAAAAGAAPPLVAAALLHDIGHLIDIVADDIADWREDAHHEVIGSRWLAQRFPAAVYEPVRLHVPAKRYLCATDTGYVAMLSPASVHTLKLQGGPMAAHEVAAFDAEAFHVDAVRIRRCDDQGKVAGLKTAGLADYRALLEGLAR
jgi:[1-hydroxy-2-(trimethylamino)ethyl]phosphonate dioxygenase